MIKKQIANKSKRVVYTVICGEYEKLNEQNCLKDGVDYICFTDNQLLKSKFWDVCYLESIDLGPSRESRRPKLLPHLFLSGYDESIYIDNSVIFKVNPKDIFDLIFAQNQFDFVCLKHPSRNCIYDEAEVVICNKIDEEQRVREQMNYYQKNGFPKQAGLIAGTFLARRHNNPDVTKTMEHWFNQVLRYSKRDQLSFTYSAWRNNFLYWTLDLNLLDNNIFTWLSTGTTDRLPYGFDDDIYLWLNPDAKLSNESARSHFLRVGKKSNRQYFYHYPNALNCLANKYKSDKGTYWYNKHFYTRVYDYYLNFYRNKSFSIFEIGLPRHDVQATNKDLPFSDAPSLLMWKDYFPHAKIYGFYIADFSDFKADRCVVIRGDQSNRLDLEKAINQLPELPFVIIDDGSHASHHQQISLGFLFQHLQPGGIYFIEDLQYQPNKLEITGTKKTISVLKELKFYGKINSSFILENEARYIEDNVDFIEFYDSMDYQSPNLGVDSLVVIKKKADIKQYETTEVKMSEIKVQQYETTENDVYKIATQLFPGPDYMQWLRHFHDILKPKSYIEIGVESGRALALAAANTRAIGIDPAFQIVHSLIASTNLFRITSDDFFANFDPAVLLGVDVIDFAFIDGLHTFDQALKDFIYIEHYAGPKTVVIFHDIYPITKETSTRERTTVFWTGDTWKVIPALRASRPDLKIFTIPTFPSGLGVITNLDPKSTILIDNFEFILKECFAWDFEAIDGTQNEILNVVPNDPVIVSELIGFSNQKND